MVSSADIQQSMIPETVTPSVVITLSSRGTEVVMLSMCSQLAMDKCSVLGSLEGRSQLSAAARSWMQSSSSGCAWMLYR